MASFPPAPRDKDINSVRWRDWLDKLRKTISSSGLLFSDLDFTGSNITSIVSRDHNDLTSKQGGTAGEFYHLTQTQHTDLTDSGDSSLHFHSSDRARSNHTGTQSLSTISDAGTAASQNYTEGTWTPTFTNLTVVLGAGAVNYSGRYQRIGNIVKFIVKITPSGGATTASTAGTTYCDMGVAASQDDVNVSANGVTLLGLGTGLIDSTSDRIYPPSWTASTDTIIISGAYEA